MKVHTDSTAAKSTCSRRGFAKLRHVQTRYLWVQERVANEEIKILKVGIAVLRHSEPLKEPYAMVPMGALLANDPYGTAVGVR